MKVIATFTASLFLSVFANAECVTVSIPQPSSRNVRIPAPINGKPVNDATFEVLADGTDVFTVRTGEQGAAVLPPLLPSHDYKLITTLDNRWWSKAPFYLLDHGSRETPTVSFDLQPAVSLTPEEVNAAARKVVVSKRVQSLKGTVLDASGAGVPGTVIWVFPEDFQGKNTAIHLVADDDGRFVSVLADGTCTVVVQSVTFRSRVVGLAIARDGKVKELEIPLEISSC